MRVLFLGMGGLFSRTVLDALTAAAVDVVGILLPGAGELRMLQPEPPKDEGASPLLPLLDPALQPTIVQRGWRHGIPVAESGRLTGPATQGWVAGLAPDVACVVCFSLKIPGDLLDLPPQGFLNTHPSLLPHYRGPEPLFWQFRAGETHTGVTIHRMDAGLDTGPILGRRSVAFADGISLAQAESLCARAGGALLVEILADMARGGRPAHPQPPGGSYQPTPTREDFTLSPTWSARRAFNFMRGTAAWGIPYVLPMEDTELHLAGAIAWEEETSAAPVEPTGDRVRIPFARGTLVARMART